MWFKVNVTSNNECDEVDELLVVMQDDWRKEIKDMQELMFIHDIDVMEFWRVSLKYTPKYDGRPCSMPFRSSGCHLKIFREYFRFCIPSRDDNTEYVSERLVLSDANEGMELPNLKENAT